MDVDQLIALVHERQPLWDRRDKRHTNRHVCCKLWKEICTAMDEDEYKLRKKWRYLRDQFTVELGKASNSSSEETTVGRIRWPYFNSLSFLKGVVNPRKRPNPDNSSASHDRDDTEDTDMIEHAQDTHDPLSSDHRRSESDDEEHLYFFKSLLPHIRKIPPHQLLSFRSSIQEVVNSYAYQGTSNSYSYRDRPSCSQDVVIKFEK